MEIERHPENPIMVSDTVARAGPVLFSLPFSTKIVNAPRYRKVKIPTMGMYSGTTDPKEHLGVCKAQMYV